MFRSLLIVPNGSHQCDLLFVSDGARYRPIPSSGATHPKAGPTDSRSVGSLLMNAGSVMLGNMEKAQRYLWLASQNDRRASETSHPPLKALFLKLASEYRNMAQQIDDPARWRAKHVASEASGAFFSGPWSNSHSKRAR